MLSNNHKVDYMSAHGLSVEQFFLLELLAGRDYRNIYKYGLEVAKFTRAEINDLINRGYLKQIPYYKDNPKKAEEVSIFELHEVSDEFFEEFFFEAGVAADEVYDTYPQMIVIDSRLVPARNISREDFRDLYAAHCGYRRRNQSVERKNGEEGEIVRHNTFGELKGQLVSKEVHERVMAGLRAFNKLQVEERITPIGLRKFIENEVYLACLDEVKADQHFEEERPDNPLMR